ncbi:bifunctional 5,10-methylenetetrahydrofolate dehydrogenase/5,10-methenyltetrahydrofolate cyclohydrolase [Vibrio coralliirubri]|uniref:bifunctional 5,10-methylenetetrahydrofolate dehydrogenase/5,10-methenyltetrahydrofolate cyclohydrolase n=1 Tax=Vibrio coralliirubri TaxID=1516159 RepID=UPI00228407BC|nr:bifunctional 5,10-methylenetetrahydrofolate dehydrogenase/5,10-methenyltetrahydrofolate cyclohydrolase [Vibrio coralliirubri]
MIINGKEISLDIIEKLKTKLIDKEQGVPCLAVILVGNDPASEVYVRNKTLACNKIGIESREIKLNDSTSEAELISIIKELNLDTTVHGVLVQLPLPCHIDDKAIIEAIDPSKDVDGFHPLNVGSLMLGSSSSFTSCTPKGIFTLLDGLKQDLTGKHCVIVGRSNIVGKPCSMLALERDMTVTVVHSKTVDIEYHTKSADVLIVAVGKPELVKTSWVKSGAIVIDVGINRIERDGEYILVGDVDKEVFSVASHMTPVPAGVGPMTIASLMQNTIQSFTENKNV